MARTDAGLPGYYGQVLDHLQRQVRSSRAAAFRAVNAEMLQLYRTIGHTLLERQRREGWDEALVDRLEAELRAAFADMAGLTRVNRLRMRAFAQAWPDPEAAPAVQRLPWGHITTLLEEVGDPQVRDWYAAAAVENGWSHDVLLNHIMARSRLRGFPAGGATRPEPGE